MSAHGGISNTFRVGATDAASGVLIMYENLDRTVELNITVKEVAFDV
jgi:hypothetical protein